MKPEYSDSFFRSATQTLNSGRSFDYALDSMSIMYVPMIYASH